MKIHIMQNSHTSEFVLNSTDNPDFYNIDNPTYFKALLLFVVNSESGAAQLVNSVKNRSIKFAGNLRQAIIHELFCAANLGQIII